MKPGLKGTYLSYCSIYMPFIKCIIVEIENTVMVTRARGVEGTRRNIKSCGIQLDITGLQ